MCVLFFASTICFWKFYVNLAFWGEIPGESCFLFSIPRLTSKPLCRAGKCSNRYDRNAVNSYKLLNLDLKNTLFPEKGQIVLGNTHSVLKNTNFADVLV